MKPKRTIADAVREGVLKRIHPKREKALELIEMGLFSVRKRLQYGKCGARTKNYGGRPCRAPALPNGKCRLHGGLSTGPRTKAGLKRMRVAASATQKRRWEQWRLGLAPRPNAPKSTSPS